jgi:hypothetical protein
MSNSKENLNKLIKPSNNLKMMPGKHNSNYSPKINKLLSLNNNYKTLKIIIKILIYNPMISHLFYILKIKNNQQPC